MFNVTQITVFNSSLPIFSAMGFGTLVSIERMKYSGSSNGRLHTTGAMMSVSVVNKCLLFTDEIKMYLGHSSHPPTAGSMFVVTGRL